MTTSKIAVAVKKVVGDVALCKISGPNVTGGVIFLDSDGGPHELEFELANGSGLDWASVPISTQENDCPATGAQAPGYSYKGKNGNNPVVQAKPAHGKKAVIHYAMHFQKKDGSPVSCDPIIIHTIADL